MLNKHKLQNNKIVLLQGENGRKLIEKNLKNKGLKISVIECYKRVLKNVNGNIETKKWRSYEINTLIVTSSEILYQLKNIISKKNQIDWLLKCKIFVVGKRLFQIAKELGWKDIIVLNNANNASFFKTIKKMYFKS
ncbi:uroporphyrinogen-III synthase [Buchnera aphidicola]|uniref:uroporphyrinogen-III synthase n=1 Tax=Buchnera aphidicola TaxID=9 RepID=UPI0021C82D86|nr:uroporphyrinogen-III synthase [Buchnera aphidicola]